MLNVRLADEERRKLHALAEQRDEPIAQVIRRYIRDEYARAFGATPPPRTRRRRAPVTRTTEEKATA